MSVGLFLSNALLTPHFMSTINIHFFVNITDTGRVTRILCQWFNSKEILSQKTVPVNYTFRKFDISNVKFSPASPDTLASGKDIVFTYDYVQSFDDTVLVYGTAIFEG